MARHSMRKHHNYFVGSSTKQSEQVTDTTVVALTAAEVRQGLRNLASGGRHSETFGPTPSLSLTRSRV